MDIITAFDSKIYKKDSKGKIRVLHVHVDGADLIQESGLVDGKLTVHRSTCKGKNIGKSNETTPEQQAILEAASKVETKMSTGYFTTQQEAKDNVVILPMLAESYNDHKDKVIFPCWAQPKLDGMRALGANSKQMISRKGKPINTMPHIQAALDETGCADWLDGELYAHGLSFQENMRLIKKNREGSDQVVYHVYDMVLPNLPFSERYIILSKLVKMNKYIELVPTYECKDEADLKDHHKQFLAQGYEGTILRHSDVGYAVNKRDQQLLKYKDFLDYTYEVVDIVPSEKNPKQGVIHCADLATNNGKELSTITFGCGMKFSHKEREEMLANKADYIGKMAEVRFFEYSETGVPRFPVCHGFRLDK
jgi:DNA ligase-1